MGMRWEKNYQIGMSQIDEQHRQFILTVEELLEALKSDKADGKAVYKDAMDFLKSYMSVHFSAEEMYQERIGFYDRENHKKLHEAFSDKIREFELSLIRCDYKKEEVQAFANFLTQWFLFHLFKEDKKMAEAANGGAAGPA